MKKRELLRLLTELEKEAKTIKDSVQDQSIRDLYAGKLIAIREIIKIIMYPDVYDAALVEYDVKRL